MTLAEKIWGSSIGAFIAYGKTAAAAALKPLLVTDNGDGTGTLVVSASSSALPTGAATAANQTTQITKLDSIIAALAQLATLQDKSIGEQVNETATGLLDTFTVDYAFVANSEQVWVNGLVKGRGAGLDYIPTGASKQIVFNAGAIPPAGATILVNYWKA